MLDHLAEVPYAEPCGDEIRQLLSHCFASLIHETLDKNLRLLQCPCTDPLSNVPYAMPCCVDHRVVGTGRNGHAHISDCAKSGGLLLQRDRQFVFRRPVVAQAAMLWLQLS